MRIAQPPASAKRGSRSAGAVRRVGQDLRAGAHIGCGTDPARAHVSRAHPPRAGQRHRGGRHRPRRHVDGRHVRSHQPRPKLHAQRRSSRLGISGRARRQVRLSGAADGRVHRRRRVLVPHRRDRDRCALGHRLHHGRQQQRRRQPVQARLRSGLWGRANRAGARAVDLPQGQLCPHRRGDGRGRAARRTRARNSRRHWPRRSLCKAAP